MKTKKTRRIRFVWKYRKTPSGGDFSPFSFCALQRTVVEYASEVNKQKSIERQQEFRITQEKDDQLAKQFKEQLEKTNAEEALNNCISDAETKKNDSIVYWKAYSDKTCIGLSVSGENYCLQGVLSEYNKAKALEKEDKDECYKRYPR